MENSLELDYPADKLHIVWVTDGSDDSTNERLQTRWQGKATVHFQPLRQGKTAAMTRGMTLVDTPLVVFTDANTMVNREAIREIVLAFQDPKVGCVAGEKRRVMVSFMVNIYLLLFLCLIFINRSLDSLF